MNENMKEFAIATAKGAVSAIPFAGGLVSEYINLAQTNVASKRMEKWMSYVEKVLKEINYSIEDLSKNEEFYSCVQATTLGAMRAYQEEKRSLFANALFSSANNLDINCDKKLFYISLLDSYTLSHITLLRYLSEDSSQQEIKNTNRGMISSRNIGGTEKPLDGILENNPEFKKDLSFAKHLLEKLISDSMIGFFDLNMPVSRKASRAKRTTKNGDDFLAFISDKLRTG